MKIQFEKAAGSLSMSPVELVLRLAPLVENFDEIWPEVDEGYVATLRQIGADRYFQPAEDHLSRARAPAQVGRPLSKDECDLLEAMVRHRHWGANRVPETAVRKMCHGAECEPIIRSLVSRGFLLQGKGNTVSLNPSAKGAIQRALSDSGRIVA